jgi:glycosyltransferase involved in cell wall biosynthesis
VSLVLNRETESLLKRTGATNVRRFLDCGLHEPRYVQNPRAAPAEQLCTLLWAGRLEHRKGLRLALEALARVRHVPVKLLVAGQGPDRGSYEKKVASLGLENTVEFLGPVPYDQMPALFRRADAFLFTSLRDSFGTVALEAMSHALPIVMLDHQGVGTFVPDAAGIKIPVEKPLQVIEGLAAAIEKIANCTPCRLRMGSAALEMANQETWEQRITRMTALYEEVISAHRSL